MKHSYSILKSENGLMNPNKFIPEGAQPKSRQPQQASFRNGIIRLIFALRPFDKLRGVHALGPVFHLYYSTLRQAQGPQAQDQEFRDLLYFTIYII
jgi:hypothetical protein